MGASSTPAGTATTDAVDELLSGYADLQAAQEAFYKDLHAHPELSHHEHRRLQDLPSNHSPKFLPPLQPTLRTGTEAMVTAARAWLGPH